MDWSARACSGALAAALLALAGAPTSLGQVGGEGTSLLEQAIERAAGKAPEPARKRMDLLARIALSPMCFPLPQTQEQADAMLESRLLPPTQETGLGPRFYTTGRCWVGAAGIGEAGRSQPAQLTYSFPDEGTTWGLTCVVFGTGPNDLGAKLTAQFGSLDRGREMIRSSIAAWRKTSGLTYTEVADDNSAQDMSATPVATRGDIRIGGWGFATGNGSNPLAYNAFPQEPASCNGGDMVLNTNYFTGLYFGNTLGNWLYFRNTIAHEHGHGLGMMHVVPCNQTKVMEPSISTGPILLSPDDVRGGIRNYGDRYSTINNHYSWSPKDFGNLTSPVVRSVVERALGVNGRMFYVSPTVSLSDDDYYRFTIGSTQNVTITVDPTGYGPTGACCVSSTCAVLTQVRCTMAGGTWVLRGTCSPTPCGAATFPTTCSGTTQDPEWCQGTQISQCSGSVASINAQNAGNLDLVLLASNGTTVLATANSTTMGIAETISMPSLAAGTYIVMVFDAASGLAVPAQQVVQTYDLTIRVGTSQCGPVAIAGLPKRARADQACHFIGNHNSYATEAGATIPPANYEWDLDGDGVFEVANFPQTSTTYRSNGVFNATLRVTDSNGLKGTDSIPVTVWGAITRVTTVGPSSGAQGDTVPITITGTNYKGVTSASQVAVSGTGVSVIGTPQVNLLGTTITGLSMVISAGAAQGSRNVTVSNSDGAGASGTGTGVFTVTAPVINGACCAAAGTCAASDSVSCTGTFQGAGSVCSPNPCPQPNVACCWASGSCTTSTAGACTTGGGSPLAVGSACSPSNPCPQPDIACCWASGACTTSTAGVCTSGGGIDQAFGSVCSPNPCPQPPGACCIGSTCSVVPTAACTGANRRFVGVGTSCNGAGNVVSPCCLADFNQDTVVSVTDIFAFLTAWFAADPASDLNGGGVGVSDIFGFLTAWFSGC